MIYTGLRKTPQYIARIAVEEDVDVVGLSILSGSHRELVEQVMTGLQELDARDIPVFVGGTIPQGDRDELLKLGVKRIFTSEMPLEEVVSSLAEALQ